MYYYTHLKQDGTFTVVDKTAKKWEYEQLRKFIQNYIEVIPDAYMPDNMNGTLYGDEEGRFNKDNKRNPFTKVLKDVDEAEWDCVGDLLLEQTEKQFNKWQEKK